MAVWKLSHALRYTIPCLFYGNDSDTKGEQGKFVQELLQEKTFEPSAPLEDEDEKDGEPDS